MNASDLFCYDRTCLNHGKIVLDNVTAGYPHHVAVSGVSGTFAQGSLTAIVGPNGGGKSTLLKTIMGLLTPKSGRVLFEHAASDHGQSTGRKKKILHPLLAYLPQSSEIDKSFPISVRDVVIMGLWHHVGLFKSIGDHHQKLTYQALETVGMADYADRLIGELSGGQLQRVLFARMILQDAPIILLDEPFSGVDRDTTQVLLNLMAKWHSQGRTIIAVLHDGHIVKDHFPTTLLLSQKVEAWGLTDDVFRAAHQTLCDKPFDNITMAPKDQ
jgi:zinc/manganese transport system ATP-binding protein